MSSNVSLTIYNLKLWTTPLNLLFVFFTVFFSLLANASIVIWPTNLVIENSAKTTILHLENRDHQPIVLQARVYQWKQVNGEEQLVQQQNIVASPPIMTIEANSQQIVRIINKQKPLVNEELTYRLIVDEIPTKDKNQQGVSFQMRYSLPIFVYGENLQHDSVIDNMQKFLSWRWIENGNKKWLELNNQGITHVHLSSIDLQQKMSNQLSSYVLPHSVIRIAINNKQIKKPQKITAVINGTKSTTIINNEF
ncbi:molecular chaperone [Orbus sturtevantii]|uniref:fimbrial biogenesis chaperone n=1 Tax=Orbus sturtevantii TaxID=3074109 RepID=UPI00370D86FB